MSFSKQQLQKFADLIRIEIPDNVLESMNIDSVIEWLNKLHSVDTTGVSPMLSPAEDTFNLRDDIITDGNIREQILSGAPDKDGNSRGYFSVPKVMDE